MDPEFWHMRWQRNEIGFHEGEANALLVESFGRLRLEKGPRVFLPLCGKTRDIAWLMAQGCRVAGAELSALAVEQLFASLGIEPEISDLDHLKRYSADGIDIFVGDIFDMTRDMLGPVDAVYDRAALVALPKDRRGPYASHLMTVTGTAPQLLICFAYDQDQMAGPPFSVSGAEIQQHYGAHYDLEQIACKDVAGGLKGRCVATEHAWLLRTA